MRFDVPGWSNHWRLNRSSSDADDRLGDPRARADAAAPAMPVCGRMVEPASSRAAPRRAPEAPREHAQGVAARLVRTTRAAWAVVSQRARHARLAFALAEVAVHAAATGRTRVGPGRAAPRRRGEPAAGIPTLPEPRSEWALPDGTRFTVLGILAPGPGAADRADAAPEPVIEFCFSQRLDDPDALVFQFSPAEWAALRQCEGLQQLSRA